MRQDSTLSCVPKSCPCPAVVAFVAPLLKHGACRLQALLQTLLLDLSLLTKSSCSCTYMHTDIHAYTVLVYIHVYTYQLK